MGQFCTKPRVKALAGSTTWTDHQAMDIDKAALVTVNRALERVPLALCSNHRIDIVQTIQHD
jgi:hypothetical protein